MLKKYVSLSLLCLLFSTKIHAIEVPGEFIADGELVPFNEIWFQKGINRARVKKFGADIIIDLREIYSIAFKVVDTKNGKLAVNIEYVDGSVLENAIYSALNCLRLKSPYGQIEYCGVESYKSLSSVTLQNLVKKSPSDGKLFPVDYLYSPISGELLEESSRGKKK